jgi:hypothetical protein
MLTFFLGGGKEEAVGLGDAVRRERSPPLDAVSSHRLWWLRGVCGCCSLREYGGKTFVEEFSAEEHSPQSSRVSCSPLLSCL